MFILPKFTRQKNKNIPSSSKSIFIKPGLGFGTGKHPTTKQCIKQIHNIDNGYVLDIGAGSGILSIVSSLYGAIKCIAIEDDELAINNAIYNIKANNMEDKIDIKKAITILSRLGKYNFSQGAVVRNKKVVAIEGKGGTQKMLKRCKSKKFRNKGVLVKLPKRKQDLRIDLPTVGLQTLTQCKSSRLKGIVLRSKQNVFLERKKCISFANKNKMFITVK
mgnify:CR=1 FL=1